LWNQIQTTQPTPPTTQQALIQTQAPERHNSPMLLWFLILVLVGVAFYFGYQNLQLRQMISQNQPPPVSTRTPTTTPDPTANWKTYTNSEIGFSLNYPKEWIQQKTNTPRVVSFDTKSDSPGEFFVAYHTNINDLSQWLLANQAGEIISTINLNNNHFSVIKGGALKASQEYAINVGANNYLRLVVEPYPNTNISDEVINQILSTFKFLK